LVDHIQDSRRLSKIRSPLSQNIRQIDTQKDSKMGTKNIHHPRTRTAKMLHIIQETNEIRYMCHE
jgi:hypothetical protein